MEKKLRYLFDYQRFQQNNHLTELIEKTMRKYGNELSDDDLEFVSAAGEIDLSKKQKAPESEDSENA